MSTWDGITEECCTWKEITEKNSIRKVITYRNFYKKSLQNFFIWKIITIDFFYREIYHWIYFRYKKSSLMKKVLQEKKSLIKFSITDRNLYKDKFSMKFCIWKIITNEFCYREIHRWIFFLYEKSSLISFPPLISFINDFFIRKVISYEFSYREIFSYEKLFHTSFPIGKFITHHWWAFLHD